MRRCKQIHSQFTGAFCNELDSESRRAFEAHLDACPRCAEAFARMSQTLEIMNQRAHHEPDDVFWAGYWDRLTKRMTDESVSAIPNPVPRRRRVEAWLFPPRWIAAGAAAAAMLVIGIFIGRSIHGPSGLQVPTYVDGQGEQAGTVQATALEDRTQQVLQQSRLLLLGLVNFDPATEDPLTLNLFRQKTMSQSLVQETDVLKTALTNSGDRRLAELVSDLEVILLQIANLESETDLDAIEMVRSGVDRRGILLKIDVEEMRRAASRAPISARHDKEIST